MSIEVVEDQPQEEPVVDSGSDTDDDMPVTNTQTILGNSSLG
jgi:hypothetical protein